MSILDRIFRRGSRGPDLTRAECYVCGKPTYYKCSVCGKYTCMAHTQPGTQSCVECFEKGQERV